MHLAAFLGVPTVAIFGSTEPAWTGPLGAGHLKHPASLGEQNPNRNSLRGQHQGPLVGALPSAPRHRQQCQLFRILFRILAARSLIHRPIP